MNASLMQYNVLGLIPTGGGKSLTFMLPALINDGVTIVIMPTLDLIYDIS